MRRLSQASLNDSSKTKLTPTATANETRSPRGRARAKILATVPKMRPTARLPKTRRSSNSVWSTCGRSKRRSDAHRITRPGRIPRRNATRKSTFEAMEAVKKARTLLKNAAGRLSSLTTGNAGLWSAGRVEPDVDAREAGPGPVSRLRGAHASGRDGVRELRGLCHRRGRRPAQPSLRARPRKSPEAIRGRLPPHETAAGPGSEWHLGERRGRSPVHLHELRRLRRRGRRKVPSVCGRVRGGAGAAGHGGGHPGSGPVPHMRRGQRSGPRGMRGLRQRPSGDEGTQPGGPPDEPSDPSDPHAPPGPPRARQGRRVPQRPEAARLRGPASGRPAAHASSETLGGHGEGSSRDAQTRPGLDGEKAGVDFHIESSGAGPIEARVADA